jgi:hypothetical protein
MRDQIKEEYKEILKFSSLYKRTKKKLFLWNNVYSNEEIFFNNNNENVKELKFKLSNHLTKEMTLPLLVPITNIDIYLPFFSKFSKEKMFKSSFEKIHKINLYPYNSFFDDKYYLFCFDDYRFKEKSDLEFNVCFIKPIYHDKGFLEINEKEKEIYFFSLPYYLMDNEEKYDKERECCYGSLFNLKKKESKILRYKCISFYNINYYLERYYLFENASIEIFTKDNKSYFFQFEAERKKKIFIEKIKKNLDKLQILEKDKIIQGWKNGKISNLEYLMKINLLANRTLRDVSLYPVFPWLTKENDIIEKKNDKENLIDSPEKKTETSKLHNFKKYIENIESKLRPLNTPMGLLEITERAKKRKLNYINMYAISMEQFNESKYNIKFNKKKESDKNIPIYDNDLTVLYNDPNVSFEEIPYIYGSHFSNPAYISHYLIRIFPFTNIGIEIQGNSFDSPDRLFINFHKSFLGSSSEKSDVREIIPQFFYLPDMFINFNQFNFGFLQKVDNNHYDVKNSTFYIQEKLNKGNEVNDCLLPYFCDNDPYKFVICYRNLLENEKVHIEDWINLIFGELSCGKKAQDIGNIFMAQCYKGVSELRIKLNKNEKKTFYRLNEIGVNPDKVLDKVYYKKIKSINLNNNDKIIPNNSISFNQVNEIQCFNDEKYLLNIVLFFEKNNDGTLLISFNVTFDGKITNLQENKVDSVPLFKNKQIKCYDFYSYKKYIMTDLINLILYKTNFFSFKNLNNPSQAYKYPNKNIITVLKISQNEKYLFIGTKYGRIIIYKIKDTQLEVHKQFTAHNKAVKYINDNNILNMFISCSHDCYVNIYLFPNAELIRVLKLDNNLIPDYVFLSSSPLPSFVIYSNTNNKFLCYSLNGKFLCENDRNDENVFSENNNNNIDNNDGKNKKKINLKFPCTIRLIDFNDYLIYFTGTFLVIRKFPFMELYRIIPNKKRIDDF